jgi:NDP-sugar pyrophosphorylase family protein
MPFDVKPVAANLSQTTALILAGGLGTRLRSVVSDLPKVLAPVRGRPFLARLLDQLDAAGVRRVVLCTGYRGELVEQAFGDRHGSIDIAYSRETAPLGTGGALRLALSLIESQTALALNGDSYCDGDLASFAAWHHGQRFSGSLMLTEVDDTSRYGRVALGADGRVERFEEKGMAHGRGWINAGLYLFDVSLLAAAAPDTALSLERDLLPKWIERPFGGFRCMGKFLDIGTPESFAQTEDFFADCSKPANAGRAA